MSYFLYLRLLGVLLPSAADFNLKLPDKNNVLRV